MYVCKVVLFVGDRSKRKVTITGYSDLDHPPLGILDSGTDVPRYGRNIDNRTGMNPQVPIVTTIPDSNRSNNCDILNLVIKTLNISYRGSPWHGTMESTSENFTGNKIFNNSERKNNFKVEKVGRKNSCNFESQIFRLDSC